MKKISFTKQQFKVFKQSFKVALQKNKDSFIFEGNEFMTSYAKYLIEHLEPQLK
jgi:hypothetical protein